MCQICGYSGHSARDCRERIPKQTSTTYDQLQYEGSDDQENNERRRDMKRQQRPLNQLAAQGDNNDLSSDGEQDFQNRLNFTPRMTNVRTHTQTQLITRLD